MAEKYGVTGSLYWHTTYYGNVPGGAARNPWEEAMSWTPDLTGTWGNGDGMLLYPHTRERSSTPVIEGPVDSLRWEMLRDGIEDREYFWTLRQEMARLKTLEGDATGRQLAAVRSALQAAREALGGPDRLARSLTEYATDPLALLAERDALARAIEACRKVR
jgi:hypothetical protein